MSEWMSVFVSSSKFNVKFIVLKLCFTSHSKQHSMFQKMQISRPFHTDSLLKLKTSH